MPAAIIGGVIAGAGAVGSAVIGSKAASSASKSAQQSADQATALQRESRDMNMQTLAPWQQSGLAANNQINALLGLGGGQPAQMGQMAGMGGMGGGDPYAAYVRGNPDLMAEFGRVGGQFGGDMGAYGQFHYGQYGQGEGRQLPNQGQMGPTGGVSSQDAARSAFDQFRNSTGYQFRLGQGMDAINSGYAGRGTIKSGAAMKGINDYGQGMASAEFGNYMGYLGNQANAGLSAANAQVGVSTSAANNMGNIAMQNGSNQANASLLRAQNTGQMFNTLGQIGGNLAGTMGGVSAQNSLYRPVYGNDAQITVTRGY